MFADSRTFIWRVASWRGVQGDHPRWTCWSCARLMLKIYVQFWSGWTSLEAACGAIFAAPGFNTWAHTPHSLPTLSSFALPLSSSLCFFHVFNAFLQLDLRQHLDKLQAASNDTNQLLFVSSSSSSSSFTLPFSSPLSSVACRLSCYRNTCDASCNIACPAIGSSLIQLIPQFIVYSLYIYIHIYLYTYISAITADVSACQMSEPFFMLISIAIEPHEPQREEYKGQEGRHIEDSLHKILC